jgi:hypothetical protein
MLVVPSIACADTQTIAAQVATQLDAEALKAFAAEDTDDPGRFVAAIYVGGHIFAISAVHPAAAFVRQEIATGNYRDVYAVLSTSSHTQGRLFVEDYGTPGLQPRREPNQPFDITRRDATDQTAFDGNWRAQRLSEAEYHRRFATDERQYEEMLRVLTTALQKRKGRDEA